MGAAASSSSDTVAEINVTPMIDVLLSLLIIFMVTAGKTQNQQPMTVPQQAAAQAQQPQDDATLLVTLREDGTGLLGKSPLAKEAKAMIDQFKASPKAQADKKIAILAEKKVPYGEVIRVMSLARQAGIASVGLTSERL